MTGNKAAKEFILKLKITLQGSEPEIWRELQVPERISLKKFHEILQIVMGWQNSHLHAFVIEGSRYSDLSHGMNDDLFEGDVPYQDESKTKLSHVVQMTDRFEYEYDFGDGWQHEITILERCAADPVRHYPVCTAGARACPPEDCGGVGGFGNLLEQIADPNDPEHESTLQWLGGFFDPEGFDPNHLNREHLWRKRW